MREAHHLLQGQVRFQYVEKQAGHSGRGISPRKGPGWGKSRAHVRIPGSPCWEGRLRQVGLARGSPTVRPEVWSLVSRQQELLRAPEGKKVVTRPVSPDGSGPPRSTQFGVCSELWWKRNVLSVPRSFQPAASPRLPTPTCIFPLPCSPPVLGRPHHPLVTHHPPRVQPSHQALASRRGLSETQTFWGAPTQFTPSPTRENKQDPLGL